MSGSKLGGQKTAATNKAKYGEDYYKRIGSIGGKKGSIGGFWHTKYVKGDAEAVAAAGAFGGRISKRGAKNG